MYLVMRFYFQLTLSVCVWQWSCNSLHGSRCWCRWARGYLEPKWGQHENFYMELFYGFYGLFL